MTYFKLEIILDDLIADEEFNLYDEVDFEKSILTNKQKRDGNKKMNYLELIVMLEEMLDNEEVNQFDEVDFEKIFKKLIDK